MVFDPTYNPYSLIGKTILITGASSGIGRATAIECSKLGAKCILIGRDESRLRETLNLLVNDGHLYFVADLTKYEEIDAFTNNIPSLDGVINNAGISKCKPITYIKHEDLVDLFEINTFAPILIIKSLLRNKKIEKGASLIFTSSISAYTASLGNSMYGASKAAILSYMHYCAKELADKSIRVNAILPGMIDTNMIHSNSFSEDDLQKDIQRYPLKRYGRPEEIAYLMIYLLSDASMWVTGQSFIIDGGISL